ncbi:MAG: polysaccharide deacetylase family protein [Rhabdaerophilum sp.]
MKPMAGEIKVGSGAILSRRKVMAIAGAAVLAPHVAQARLGTARTLPVPNLGRQQFGQKSYAETLPLADGEVVLTFDDGPVPGLTDRVLNVLEAENVRGTFFLIGRNAVASPHLVRRMLTNGHTVANHTMNHPWTLRNISHERALADIEAGERAIMQAAGQNIAPFFRFPGFADTPRLLDALAAQNRAVFGADLWASDWNAMAPGAQLQLIMSRLRRQRRGIILFHDTRPQTVAMLPEFLASLKRENFRVVHTIAG